MPTVLSSFRDYLLVAVKRFPTVAGILGFHLLLNDGTSKLLNSDGDYLVIRAGGTVQTHGLQAQHRDYNLTVEKRN